MIHKALKQALEIIKNTTKPDIVLVRGAYSSYLRLKHDRVDFSKIEDSTIRNLLVTQGLNALHLKEDNMELSYDQSIENEHDLKRQLITLMIILIEAYGNNHWSKRYGSTIVHKQLREVMRSDFDTAYDIFTFVCNDVRLTQFNFDEQDAPSKYTSKEKKRLITKALKRRAKRCAA